MIGSSWIIAKIHPSPASSMGGPTKEPQAVSRMSLYSATVSISE